MNEDNETEGYSEHGHVTLVCLIKVLHVCKIVAFIGFVHSIANI